MTEKKEGSFLGGLLSLIFIVIAVIYFISIFKGDDEQKEKNVDVNSFLKTSYAEDSEEMKIAKSVSSYIYSDIDATEITKMTINNDLGTETPDDYILLIDLTWNDEYTISTTKDLIRIYCENIAAHTIQNNNKVQEIAMFWDIPYHKENIGSAKCSYERRNGGMYLTDKMGLVGDK